MSGTSCAPAATCAAVCRIPVFPLVGRLGKPFRSARHDRLRCPVREQRRSPACFTRWSFRGGEPSGVRLRAVRARGAPSGRSSGQSSIPGKIQPPDVMTDPVRNDARPTAACATAFRTKLRCSTFDDRGCDRRIPGGSDQLQERWQRLGLNGLVFVLQPHRQLGKALELLVIIENFRNHRRLAVSVPRP